MHEESRLIRLLDGREVRCRALLSADEEPLVRFFRELPAPYTQYRRDNLNDVEVVRQALKDVLVGFAACTIALDLEGDIVGVGKLLTSYRGWRRHVGEVRVVMAPDYLNQGLARHLLREMVRLAHQRRLHKLEALVLDTQVETKSALRALGFQEEARLAEHARDFEGRDHDLLILTHRVQDLWVELEDLVFYADTHIGKIGY